MSLYYETVMNFFYNAYTLLTHFWFKPHTHSGFYLSIFYKCGVIPQPMV